MVPDNYITYPPRPLTGTHTLRGGGLQVGPPKALLLLPLHHPHEEARAGGDVGRQGWAPDSPPGRVDTLHAVCAVEPQHPLKDSDPGGIWLDPINEPVGRLIGAVVGTEGGLACGIFFSFIRSFLEKTWGAWVTQIIPSPENEPHNHHGAQIMDGKKNYIEK